MCDTIYVTQIQKYYCTNYKLNDLLLSAQLSLGGFTEVIDSSEIIVKTAQTFFIGGLVDFCHELLHPV